MCPSMEECGGVQRIITMLANRMADHYTVTLIEINNRSGSTYYPLKREVRRICFNRFVYRKRRMLSAAVRKTMRKCPVVLPVRIAEYVYFPVYLCEDIGEVLRQEKCDCIIASTPHCVTLLGILKKYLPGIRLIGWQHSSYEIYYETPSKGFYTRKKLAEEAYQKLDRLVTLTERDAKEYRKKMKLDSEYIYNPLSFQCEQKSTLESKRIIFVGRLESYLKGLDFLVEIICKIVLDRGYRDWVFQLVGDGTDRAELESQIKKAYLQKNVEFLGEHKDVEAYYCNASIFISTSRFEGFGLAVTEAMECGLPVVAFRTDGPSEIIYDGVNGYLIEKYSVEQFVDSVEQLMVDPDLRKKFSQNAILRAKDFHMDQILERWERVIHE